MPYLIRDNGRKRFVEGEDGENMRFDSMESASECADSLGGDYTVWGVGYLADVDQQLKLPVVFDGPGVH